MSQRTVGWCVIILMSHIYLIIIIIIAYLEVSAANNYLCSDRFSLTNRTMYSSIIYLWLEVCVNSACQLAHFLRSSTFWCLSISSFIGKMCVCNYCLRYLRTQMIVRIFRWVNNELWVVLTRELQATELPEPRNLWLYKCTKPFVFILFVDSCCCLGIFCLVNFVRTCWLQTRIITSPLVYNFQ